MSAYFIYDNNNNMSIGSVTKTQNGIVVKSHYSPSILDYCSKWEDVEFVNGDTCMEAPTYVFFTPSEIENIEMSEEISNIIKKHPACSVYKTPNIIVGENMNLNLEIAMFHGLDELMVPQLSELTQPQKKLFKKICVKI